MPCTKINGGKDESPRDVQWIWYSKTVVEWWKIWVSSIVGDDDEGLMLILILCHCVEYSTAIDKVPIRQI